MDYTGYKKVILTDDELARIYQKVSAIKLTWLRMNILLS